MTIDYENDILNLGTPKSTKDFIRKYIILNLYYKRWNLYSQIPSENAFAIKFDCTRATARTALQIFIDNGILESTRGSGYFIKANIRDFLFRDHNYDSITIDEKKVNMKNLDWIPKEIKDRIISNIKDATLFERKFIDEKNTLREVSFQWFNSKENQTKGRSIQTIINSLKERPTSSYYETFIVDSNKIEIFQEFKLKNKIILELEIVSNSKGWLFIKIFARKLEDFKVVNNKKYIL